MEGNMKSSARGIKGKVVMVYSKYAKAQTNSAPSVATQVYNPGYTSYIDAEATADNVDERATAFIRAVRERQAETMEGNMKSSARGIKGKVVMAKAQTNSAPSVVTQVYTPGYTSSIDAAVTAGNVDERATAFIRAVRERFNNEQKMA